MIYILLLIYLISAVICSEWINYCRDNDCAVYKWIYSVGAITDETLNKAFKCVKEYNYQRFYPIINTIDAISILLVIIVYLGIKSKQK